MPPQIETEYRALRTPAEVRDVVESYATAQVVAFDTETDSKTAVGARLVGFSFAFEPGRACYVPIAHDDEPTDADGLLAEMRGVLEAETPLKVAHNAKFDCEVLGQAGVAVRAGFDTSLAAYVLNETSVGLKDLALTRLGIDMTPISALLGRGKAMKTMNQVGVEDSAAYASADADVTLRLYHLFGPELESRGQTTLLQ
ncbi:MAG: DNA polymerase I, partial [Chloroflexia bacterium]